MTARPRCCEPEISPGIANRRPKACWRLRITGAGPVAAADPGLWAALPVLPLIQPSSIFAVSDALRSVLDAPHDGWAWTGPLSGLSGWPVP